MEQEATMKMIGAALTLAIFSSSSLYLMMRAPDKTQYYEPTIRKDFVCGHEWLPEPITEPSGGEVDYPIITIGLDGGLRVEVSPGVTVDSLTGQVDYNFERR
jgi:hypothetical protein